MTYFHSRPELLQCTHMIMRKWHDWLDQPKYDEQWHRNDMADELAEYREETKLLKKWSEASDVVYTYTRSKWSGHGSVEFPLGRVAYVFGVLYMYPKYSLRQLFFQRAGKRAGKSNRLRCVRNPRKTHKLHQIAEDNKLDKDKFQNICEKQLRYWPLLP